MYNKNSPILFALALMSFGATDGALAGSGLSKTQQAIEPVKEKSLCDTIFALPTIYKDKENPYIQKVAFIGRYHGQFHYLDSNQGDHDDWENRRARLGMAIEFLKSFSFDFNFNLDVEGDGGRIFESLEDATLKWTLNKEFSISVGKQKAPISHEWSASSNKILTIERSRLSGTIAPNKMGGILLSYHQKGGFIGKFGVYSNAVDEDWEYPTFDGSASVFGSIGYELDKNSTIRLDYLFQDIGEGTNQYTPYEHAFSLNYDGKFDKFGLIADAMYGFGHGKTPDAYGIVLIPTYDITPWLKAVVRYTYGGSESDGGFSLQKRYERQAPDLITKNGNNYHAIYAGLNWYICGDKFKFMTGAEYATMDQNKGSKDFESVTYFGAVRLYF